MKIRYGITFPDVKKLLFYIPKLISYSGPVHREDIFVAAARKGFEYMINTIYLKILYSTLYSFSFSYSLRRMALQHIAGFQGALHLLYNQFGT